MTHVSSSQRNNDVNLHTQEILAVALNRLGNVAVSGSADRSARVWNTVSAQAMGTLRGHTGRVTCVALSPDGRYAFTGSDDKSVRMWDSASGKLIRQAAALAGMR